jgi:hypothetical protein
MIQNHGAIMGEYTNQVLLILYIQTYSTDAFIVNLKSMTQKTPRSIRNQDELTYNHSQ